MMEQNNTIRSQFRIFFFPWPNFFFSVTGDGLVSVSHIRTRERDRDRDRDRDREGYIALEKKTNPMWTQVFCCWLCGWSKEQVEFAGGPFAWVTRTFTASAGNCSPLVSPSSLCQPFQVPLCSFLGPYEEDLFLEWRWVDMHPTKLGS